MKTCLVPDANIPCDNHKLSLYKHLQSGELCHLASWSDRAHILEPCSGLWAQDICAVLDCLTCLCFWPRQNYLSMGLLLWLVSPTWNILSISFWSFPLGELALAGKVFVLVWHWVPDVWFMGVLETFEFLWRHLGIVPLSGPCLCLTCCSVVVVWVHFCLGFTLSGHLL